MHTLNGMDCRVSDIHIPDTVMDSAFAVRDRFAKGQNVVFHGELAGGWYRSMQTHGLTHDHVEIRKCDQLIHRRIICFNNEEFVP